MPFRLLSKYGRSYFFTFPDSIISCQYFLPAKKIISSCSKLIPTLLICSKTTFAHSFLSAAEKVFNVLL